MLCSRAAFAMADLVHLRVHSFGSIEFLTRTPMAINAGLALDIFNFVAGNSPLWIYHAISLQLHD